MNQFNNNPWTTQGIGSPVPPQPPSFRISSFNSDITLAERGVDTTPTLTWNFQNGVPVTQNINGTVVPNANRALIWTLPINNTTVFTLQAFDGVVNRSNSLTVDFVHPIFVGAVISETPVESEILAMGKRIARPISWTQDFIIDDARTAVAIHSSLPRFNAIRETLFNLDVRSEFNIYVNIGITTNAGVQMYTVYIWNILQNTMGGNQPLQFAW